MAWRSFWSVARFWGLKGARYSSIVVGLSLGMGVILKPDWAWRNSNARLGIRTEYVPLKRSFGTRVPKRSLGTRWSRLFRFDCHEDRGAAERVLHHEIDRDVGHHGDELLVDRRGVVDKQLIPVMAHISINFVM